ncbi:MAG TPA: hypothetical protein VJ845_02545 [Haploplasma sp.]|nr:hypothetical protein [Haploplasma sp.]
MLRRINISIRIAMVLVVILSLFNFFLNLNWFAVPAPFFAAFNLVLVVTLTFLPEIFRRMQFELSNGLYYLIMFSVLVSFVGGMGFKLYQILTFYDTIIHFFNGGVIAVVGFALLRSQFDNWYDNLGLIAIGAILIAISVGAVWEIYEFVADILLDGNMQRYKDIFKPNDPPFSGQEALMDTMIDLIVDTVGGIVGSIILYRSAIKKGTLSNLFVINHLEKETK